MKHFGIIYLIWCKVTGKKYVGQTTRTLEERFGEHCCANSYIGKAIRKYGRENFICGVIKTCATKAELNACEIFYIAVLKSRAPYGYNFTDGGEGGSGVSQKGENNPNYGKHCTPEICMRIGASRYEKSPYKNLIAEMQARQLTYKSLAKLLGLTYSSIAYKMRGEIRFTDADKVKLVEIFGKPIEWLLTSAIPLYFGTWREVQMKNSAAHRKTCWFPNLTTEMNKRQLTYKSLAELLGLSVASVSMKLRGERNFTDAARAKLVEIFGKPIEWLLASEVEISLPRREKKCLFPNLTVEMQARQLMCKSLAELLGLSYSAVAYKMSGRLRFTDKDKAKLVEIFDKPIEWLLFKYEH